MFQLLDVYKKSRSVGWVCLILLENVLNGLFAAVSRRLRIAQGFFLLILCFYAFLMGCGGEEEWVTYELENISASLDLEISTSEDGFALVRFVIREWFCTECLKSPLQLWAYMGTGKSRYTIRLHGSFVALAECTCYTENTRGTPTRLRGEVSMWLPMAVYTVIAGYKAIIFRIEADSIKILSEKHFAPEPQTD